MINNLTEIVILLDKSGSMLTTKQQTLDGMNDYLEDLRESGEACNVSLIQFSSNTYDALDYIETPATPIALFPDLTADSYRPNGNTPLYDSVCKAIDELGARLSRMDESRRPGKVIVVIVTDGFNNSSYRHTASDVKMRIEHQQSVYQWKFVFLGANQDAITTASQMGIPMAAALTYTQDTDGLKGAYAVLGEATRGYLCCSSASAMADLGFTESQRARSVSRQPDNYATSAMPLVTTTDSTANPVDLTK